MNPRRPAALVVLLALAAPAAAAPPDPAALFPADTLAYAELHDPAAVAPDLAALVRGSALDDIVGYVHKKRDGTTEPRDLQKDEIALLGLVASPEFAAELPRLRVAAGLLGFTDRGEPRWAVAVLTGDSPAAGLVAKGFLATADGLRKVGAVGDVPVFQYRQPMYVYDQAENRQKLDTTNAPAEGAHEPTFATVPGLFVVGTDKAAIGELVNRFRGKGGAALAGAATYREATAHRRPGLFVYADARAFAAAHTNALKAAGRGTEPDALGWFKLVADVRAVRYVAGVVQVRDGGLAVSAVTAFEPGKASPLLTILGGPAADAGLLRYAPGPAAVAVAAALPEAGRAAAVVGFLDALAKAGGGLGPLPSDRVKELDAKYGTKSADELAARLRAVTVVLPAKQELPKGAAPLPTLVLHADGPDAAAAWLAFLPRLAGHVAKTDPPQPATEAIGGVKVYSLPAAGMPGNSPIHYAAKGAAVAIGQDRAVVAAAVAGGAEAKGPAAPAGDPAPAVVGTVSLSAALNGLSDALRSVGPVATPSNAGPPLPGRVRRFEAPPPPGFEAKQTEAETKAWAEVAKALDALPPAALTVRRAGDEVRAELWVPKVRDGGLATAVTAAVGWFDVRLNRTADRFGNRYGYSR